MYELLNVDLAQRVATTGTYSAAMQLGVLISKQEPSTRFALVWHEADNSAPEQVARFKAGCEFLLTSIAGAKVHRALGWIRQS